MTSHADRPLIVASLERAAARCADLTPIVYDKLFAARPETRALFRSDPKNLIKGSMLELALEAIVDFVGERKAAHRLIFAEVQSHDGYGTSVELFSFFFDVIADAVRDVLADDWSPALQTAWDRLIEELHRYVASGAKAMA